MNGSATWRTVMADITRVWQPSFSSASWTARALIRVASIPMESAVTRSIPRVSAPRPRKMLPPPITQAVSDAVAVDRGDEPGHPLDLPGEIPACSSPLSAWPDSLSRTRFGPVI